MPHPPAKKATSLPGVRIRKHPTRKHGAARFDEHYFIRHRVDGKLIEESCGWASQGWTADKAYKRLAEFKENTRKGIGPRTMKELREMNRKEQEQRASEEREMKRLDAQKHITFSELFDLYSMAGIVRKKAKVLMVETGRFKSWLQPHLGDTPAIQITPEMLESLQSQILTEGRSSQTASHVIDLFRATWRWAQKRKLINKECPVSNMERVKPANIKERCFTTKELYSILDWLYEHDMNTALLTLCAAHTGARLGELAQLTWHDIDFREQQINFTHTKTGKPRSVPMSSPLTEALARAKPAQTEGHVFVQKNGKPFFTIKDSAVLTNTPYYFRQALAGLDLNKNLTSNLMKLNFHSLRHTCATNLLRAGTDPRTVQEILGWSTMKMLERYTHVVPESKRQAIGALSNMLSQHNK